MQISLCINNRACQIDVRPDEMLLETLRKRGLMSVRQGCDTRGCGICTVWVQEQPVLSCSYPAVRADGKRITTLEGLQEEAEQFTKYMAREGADQCGYCSPGLIMTVLAMKRQLKNPNQEAIRRYLVGNLCRCTGYAAQQRAIEAFMGVAP